MKKILLPFALLLMTVACHRQVFDAEKQAKQDDEIIKAYIAEKGLNATATGSGLYYMIIEEGTGDHPVATSRVKVNYKGYFTNGNVFDQTTGAPVVFPLADLIKGWQEGIPLLKEGGSGIFLVPSGLGYGNKDIGPIPANSVLVFEIALVEVL
jgi:FKBP-type peptidyl-prolyl cis-trans isomerase FkpA